MRPRAVTILFGWNDHWTTFGIEGKDIGKVNLEQPAWLLQLSEFRVVQLVNRAIFSLKYPMDASASSDRKEYHFRTIRSTFPKWFALPEKTTSHLF
ncbi:MAG TPA: hypothetical protein VGB89_06570 [Bacteroidota bacterium]